MIPTRASVPDITFRSLMEHGIAFQRPAAPGPMHFPPRAISIPFGARSRGSGKLYCERNRGGEHLHGATATIGRERWDSSREDFKRASVGKAERDHGTVPFFVVATPAGKGKGRASIMTVRREIARRRAERGMEYATCYILASILFTPVGTAGANELKVESSSSFGARSTATRWRTKISSRAHRRTP